MVTFLKIVGGLLALAYGVYLGLGRGYSADPEEIDHALGERRRHQKVRRHFTFLNMIKKVRERGSDARRRSQKRKPFQLNR